MNLANIAIGLLWLLIGAIILAGVIWLVLYGVEKFITPIPERLKQGIWFIILILILIGVISTLATGRPPFQGNLRISSSAFATLPAPAPAHL